MKYPEKIKCSAIYFNQTSESWSQSSGSGIGVTSGGLGVGAMSGRSHTLTKTKLADLFSPIKNYQINDSDPMMKLVFASALSYITLNVGKIAISLGLTLSEIVIKSLIMIFGMITGYLFMSLFASFNNGPKKYSDTQMSLINSRYDQAFYCPKNHLIFIDENETFPATRENFEKLLTMSL